MPDLVDINVVKGGCFVTSVTSDVIQYPNILLVGTDVIAAKRVLPLYHDLKQWSNHDMESQ